MYIYIHVYIYIYVYIIVSYLQGILDIITEEEDGRKNGRKIRRVRITRLCHLRFEAKSQLSSVQSPCWLML